jgi:hypothetical protein
MRRLTVLALLPLLLVGFTACGSDGGGGSGSDGDALSAADFKAQANQICTDGNKALEDVTKDLDDDATPEEVGEAVSKGLDLLSDQLDEIRDLRGPDELDADVEEVLDDTQDAIDTTKEKLADDPEATLDGADPFADVSQRLTDLGLDVCGAS